VSGIENRTFHGIGVSAGTAVGPLVIVTPAPTAPADEAATTDAAAASAQVRDVLEQVASGLEARAATAADHARPILEAGAMMARDPGLAMGIDTQLQSGKGPATAVTAAVEEYCAMFLSLGGYMAERVTDLRDVRDRAVARLLGQAEPGVPQLAVPSILAAHDLAPAETATLTSDTCLGIVTAATLKLFAKPRQTVTAWLAVAGPAAAVDLLSRLRGIAGDRVTAFELISRPSLDLVLQHIPDARDPLPSPQPWYVLVELTDTLLSVDLGATLETELAAAISDGLVADGTIAASQAQAAALWRLRENISEAQKREGISIKHDVSVPVSAIPEFIERAAVALQQCYPGVRIVAFGHLGDGNLHYNLSRPSRDENADFIARTEDVGRVVHDLVHQLGGSISAEHGIGQLKRALLPTYKPPVELDLMHRIKAALDPQGLMNPGKVL